jgi:hypothetical protein
MMTSMRHITMFKLLCALDRTLDTIHSPSPASDELVCIQKILIKYGKHTAGPNFYKLAGRWYVHLGIHFELKEHSNAQPTEQMEWYVFDLDERTLRGMDLRYLRFERIGDTLEFKYGESGQNTGIPLSDRRKCTMVAYTPAADSCFVTGDRVMTSKGYAIEIKPEVAIKMKHIDAADIKIPD